MHDTRVDIWTAVHADWGDGIVMMEAYLLGVAYGMASSLGILAVCAAVKYIMRLFGVVTETE